MSGEDYEAMKQLLDDQSRTILSEIKSHVKAEVTAQLGPHVSRVDQLYDDQAQIRKQLSDITTFGPRPYYPPCLVRSGHSYPNAYRPARW